MTTIVRFAFSTHALAAQPLTAHHLAALGRMPFRELELFASPGHVDLTSREAMVQLARWVADAHVRVGAVHTPITERAEDGASHPAATLASPDDAGRQRAIQHARAALAVQDVLGFEHLVVHLGTAPDAARRGDGTRASACRGIEAVAELAARRGVRLALEVVPNKLSTVESLVDLIENELETSWVGICFDTGHAHLQGDVIEGLELASGHLLSVHLSDNRGHRGDHLLPFEGGIDWAATMMTLQKIGYDGPLVFTPAPGRPFDQLLERARASAQRLEDLCA